MLNLNKMQNFVTQMQDFMRIQFKDTKENRCYEDFVNNPSDRTKMRAFKKMYGAIEDEAVKLHKRLNNSETVAAYNKIYGSTNNRIETKSGGKDKEPFILKVRVTGSYRKFFYHVLNSETMEFLKKKDWAGQFEDVSHIFVIAVNNHDYNIT